MIIKEYNKSIQQKPMHMERARIQYVKREKKLNVTIQKHIKKDYF